MDYRFEKMEDIKLIILTVINDFSIPVSNAMIVDTVLTHSYAQYFDIQQYLFELTDSQLVTYYVEKSVRYYSLTRKGKEALEFFSKNIPVTVREKLFATAKAKSKELRDSMSVNTEFYKENDLEYTLVLKIVECGYDLFNLKLTVGSEAIAKNIAARFEKNPQELYSRIFSVLVDENSEN